MTFYSCLLHFKASVQLVIPTHTLVLPFTAGTPFLYILEVVHRGIFEHTIWMAHTAIHKNTLIEDCDNLLFLILTKPASDISLVPSIDPLVCEMDVITIFIAWNIIPLY